MKAISVLFILCLFGTVSFFASAGMTPEAEVFPQRVSSLVEAFPIDDVASIPVFEDGVLDLWDWYDITSEIYGVIVEEMESIGEMNPRSTHHNRLMHEHVQVGDILVTIVSEIHLRDEELSERDIEYGLDVKLTTMQHVAVTLRQLDRCAESTSLLTRVLAHPAIAVRPMLLRDTERAVQLAYLCQTVQYGARHAETVLATVMGWTPPIAQEVVPDFEPVSETNLALPIMTTASGAALLIAGGVLQVVLRADVERYNAEVQRCGTPTGCSSTRLETFASQAEQRYAVSLGGMIGGGVALVGGSIWTFVRATKTNNDSIVAPTATVVRRGFSTGLRIEW